MLLQKTVCSVIAITLTTVFEVSSALCVTHICIPAGSLRTRDLYLFIYSMTRFSHVQVSLNEVIAGLKGLLLYSGLLLQCSVLCLKFALKE
jgi:hypothetical protein